MNDTVFYVVGIVLVVAALVVSAVGLRFKEFPASTPLLFGVVAVFVVLVGGTTVFAWRNAEDEEAHREAEHIEPPAVEPSGEVVEEENTPADTATGSPATATTTGETTTATASTAEGAQLFESQGCNGCHTLAAAGSTATTGPVLDDALKGKSKQFISTSITDPNADIAKGFQPDVMPQTFGQSMTPEELNALVEYLYQSVNAKG
jgi:mono/diheme cytochrome c family protein